MKKDIYLTDCEKALFNKFVDLSDGKVLDREKMMRTIYEAYDDCAYYDWSIYWDIYESLDDGDWDVLKDNILGVLPGVGMDDVYSRIEDMDLSKMFK